MRSPRRRPRPTVAPRPSISHRRQSSSRPAGRSADRRRAQPVRTSRVCAELVRDYLRIQRLKIITALVVVFAVAVSLPVASRLDDAVRDPAFAALDELRLPRWASAQPVDTARGSRWCFERCRIRERNWESTGDADATVEAFGVALTDQHWRAAAGCTAASHDGEVRCFVRDEYELVLWVRPAQCADPRQRCPAAAVTAVVRPATGAPQQTG
jgi:hypothetical protein